LSVYVDPPRTQFRGQLFCHVWADTLEELHAAANAAGLKREWFQEPPRASWPHYDCGTRIRARLVANGAIETDSRAPVLHRQAWLTSGKICEKRKKS
jgi:hypothetical protein